MPFGKDEWSVTTSIYNPNPAVWPFITPIQYPQDCTCVRCLAYREACVQVSRLLEGVRDGNIVMAEELLRDATTAVMDTVRAASGRAPATNPDEFHVPGRLWPCLWKDVK